MAEDGTERLEEPEDQAVYCEIVLSIYDKEAVPMESSKTWLLT